MKKMILYLGLIISFNTQAQVLTPAEESAREAQYLLSKNDLAKMVVFNPITMKKVPLNEILGTVAYKPTSKGKLSMLDMSNADWLGTMNPVFENNELVLIDGKDHNAIFGIIATTKFIDSKDASKPQETVYIVQTGEGLSQEVKTGFIFRYAPRAHFTK